MSPSFATTTTEGLNVRDRCGSLSIVPTPFLIASVPFIAGTPVTSSVASGAKCDVILSASFACQSLTAAASLSRIACASLCVSGALLHPTAATDKSSAQRAAETLDIKHLRSSWKFVRQQKGALGRLTRYAARN